MQAFIAGYCEIKGQLFTTVKDITAFENIEDLVAKHNNLLWFGHRDDCSLVIEHGQIFISGYKNHTNGAYLTEKLLNGCHEAQVHVVMG